MSATTEAIVAWLRQQLTQSGAGGFVVGLSGGVDSAVVARLCQAAAPANVVGVIMPCHSEPDDDEDARLVASTFNLPTVRVDLTSAHTVLLEALHGAVAAIPKDQLPATPSGGELRARLAGANVKPRLRMTTLYFLANTLNYLVAGTGNRSELAIGYFTKHGDGGVDLLPIGHLVKSEVRGVARELHVPSPIIERRPSAGLWMGQIDEEEMGFTYAELERYLDEGPQGVSPALAMRIERLTRSSEHKRALPPIPDMD